MSSTFSVDLTSVSTPASSSMFSNRSVRPRALPVPSAESIRASPMFRELESEWDNMLAHQLRALPAFQHFWAEVPSIFAWLRGEEPAEELEPTSSR